MKITQHLCYNCQKRTADCRLTCGSYKVYHAAKMKEYEERKRERELADDSIEHVIRSSDRRRRRIGYTNVNRKGYI